MEIADNFTAKRKRGEVQAHGSGYGGSGFKFDAEEEELRNAERKVQACPFCCVVPALLQLLCACQVVLMQPLECPKHDSQQRIEPSASPRQSPKSVVDRSVLSLHGRQAGCIMS